MKTILLFAFGCALCMAAVAGLIVLFAPVLILVACAALCTKQRNASLAKPYGIRRFDE